MKECWGKWGRISRETAIDNFWKRVNKAEAEICWEWTGARQPQGYGILTFAGKQMLAHRLAFLLHSNIEPAEKFVMHKCDNPPCCNPHHLILGTVLDNVRDMESKNRSKHPAGENHGRAKLTAADVEEIRRQLAAGKSIRSLARLYGVAKPTISRINNGRGWIKSS